MAGILILVLGVGAAVPVCQQEAGDEIDLAIPAFPSHIVIVGGTSL